MQPIYIGCAGWSIRKEHADDFPATGTHLERYARRFPAVEINSSFYRQHRIATYARWADSVPEEFRFSVKIPREITHRQRLNSTALLDDFLPGPQALGDKLGPLLLQLPPSLIFEENVATAFFTGLRERFDGDVVCEPRHSSWFSDAVEPLLVQWRISRAAVDPAPVSQAAEPGGWQGLAYFRLHGSPRMYYSAYSDTYLGQLVNRLQAIAGSCPVWCIFDNTAAGAATPNALQVLGGIKT